jgi:hypothetical protein
MTERNGSVAPWENHFRAAKALETEMPRALAPSVVNTCEWVIAGAMMGLHVSLWILKHMVEVEYHLCQSYQ